MDSPTVHFSSNFPLWCFCTPLRWITEHTGSCPSISEKMTESEISSLADYGSVHSWFICLNLPMMPSMSSTVMQLASTVEDYCVCVCVQLMHLLLSSLSLMMTLVSFSFPFCNVLLYCSPFIFCWCIHQHTVPSYVMFAVWWLCLCFLSRPYGDVFTDLLVSWLCAVVMRLLFILMMSTDCLWCIIY